MAELEERWEGDSGRSALFFRPWAALAAAMGTIGGKVCNEGLPANADPLQHPQEGIGSLARPAKEMPRKQAKRRRSKKARPSA